MIWLTGLQKTQSAIHNNAVLWPALLGNAGRLSIRAEQSPEQIIQKEVLF